MPAADRTLQLIADTLTATEAPAMTTPPTDRIPLGDQLFDQAAATARQIRADRPAELSTAAQLAQAQEANRQLHTRLGRAESEARAMVRDRDEAIAERDRARAERDTLADAMERGESVRIDAHGTVWHTAPNGHWHHRIYRTHTLDQLNAIFGQTRPALLVWLDEQDDEQDQDETADAPDELPAWASHLLAALDTWGQRWHRLRLGHGATPAQRADIALLAAYDAHWPTADAQAPGSAPDRAQGTLTRCCAHPGCPRTYQADVGPQEHGWQRLRGLTVLCPDHTSPALPGWVLDLVRGLADYEDEHPKLYRWLDGARYEQWTCPGALLDLVPSDVRARAARPETRKALPCPTVREG